jgi:GNAT superfamily N-acetyltransferase
MPKPAPILEIVASSEITYRPLTWADLDRLGDIDRSERIESIYVQSGSHLEEREGDFSAPPWPVEGESEHSVAAQRSECERHLNAGGTGQVAFAHERLVGIALMKPHVRPGIAQLAYLHVSDGYRGRGIGGRLSDGLEALARAGGDTSMVVSATPSVNTVDFYLRRGFEPMAEPLPELYELEPDDVHLRKRLGMATP